MFDGMTYQELKQARDEIENLMETRRIAALEEFKAAAETMDIDLGALIGRMNGHAPKYRNPHNPDETYTGKGKHPEWLKTKLAEGATLDDFRAN